MILMIDNYDSFTYNLVQYLGELGAEVVVHRNDKITLKDIEQLNPEKIVISPGPCTPEKAGISMKTVRHFSGEIPLLGVCLGHQPIASTFGGQIIKAKKLMHGKTSPIEHDNRNLFKDLPNPLTATRYHSLLLEQSTLPECIKVTAQTKEGEIMGIEHTSLPIWGVQFHPESLATEKGIMILKNFLDLC